jgi:hypothetical protein
VVAYAVCLPALAEADGGPGGTQYYFAACYLEASQPAPSVAARKPSRLRVFPLDAAEVVVDLPIDLGPSYVAGPEGGSFYGARSLPGEPLGFRQGLVRFDLATSTPFDVPGSHAFVQILGAAVSGTGQLVVVSGGYARAGHDECGLFEFGPGMDLVRALALQKGGRCGLRESWHDLSITADGLQVLACAGRSLDLIDTRDGRIQRISGEFWRGGVSPDGKWIAAIGRSGVTLIDAHDLARRRNLGRTGSDLVRWSPDSRYLLLLEGQFLRCGPYFGTFQALDVFSGKKSEIRSSRCKIASNNGSWVDLRLLRSPPKSR